jgi:hypothetical protein
MKYSLVVLAAAAVVAISVGFLIGMPANTKVADAQNKSMGGSSLPALSSSRVTIENDTKIPAGEYSMAIYTDRQVYPADSKVNITVNITVPEDMENSEVRFFGIRNRYGSYRVKKDIDTDLVKGLNTLGTWDYVPACSTCAGISPGVFNITAVLEYHDRQVINATVSINITEEA